MAVWKPIDLYDVMDACSVVTVGLHDVLCGALLADTCVMETETPRRIVRRANVLVVASTIMRVRCFCCASLTDGRLVFANREGRVTRIEPVCRECHAIIAGRSRGVSLAEAVDLAQEAAARWQERTLLSLQQAVWQNERRRQRENRAVFLAALPALPATPPGIPLWCVDGYVWVPDEATVSGDPAPASETAEEVIASLAELGVRVPGSRGAGGVA